MEGHERSAARTPAGPWSTVEKAAEHFDLAPQTIRARAIDMVRDDWEGAIKPGHEWRIVIPLMEDYFAWRARREVTRTLDPRQRESKADVDPFVRRNRGHDGR